MGIYGGHGWSQKASKCQNFTKSLILGLFWWAVDPLKIVS